LTVVDVIHTVGPQGENSAKLKNCYSHCFEEMLNLHQKSIVRWCLLLCVDSCAYCYASHWIIESIDSAMSVEWLV